MVAHPPHFRILLNLSLPPCLLDVVCLYDDKTDPLTTLLTKYISNPERRPQRDLTGEWTRTDFHTLVVSAPSPAGPRTGNEQSPVCPPQTTNSWRALARMARDRIVQADPEDLPLVLNARAPRPSASPPKTDLPHPYCSSGPSGSPPSPASASSTRPPPK